MGRLSVNEKIKQSEQTATVESVSDLTGMGLIDTAAYNSLTKGILDYYNIDQQKKSISTLANTKKQEIIDLMKSLSMDELKVNGIKCTLSTRTNKSMDQEKLLAYCKKLKIKGLVKRVEIVDLDVLENLTYTRQIDPKDIEQFTTKSITESVRLSGKLKI